MLPNTIVLTLTGLIVAYLFGVLVGAWLAWKRGTWIEGVTIPTVLTLRAAPEFWLGMILLAVFSFQLGWFPSGGANSPGAIYPSEWARLTSRDFLWHLVLPAATLALYLQGLPLLLMRSNMLDVMSEDFITMARMKGLSQWTIVMRHAARNALLPVATAFALGLRRLDRRQCRGRDASSAGRGSASCWSARSPRATIRWRRARSSSSPSCS